MSSGCRDEPPLIRFVAGAGLARSEKQGRGCAASEPDSKKGHENGHIRLSRHGRDKPGHDGK